MDMWLDEDDIWQMETHFSIDDVTWHPEMMGGPSQILPDSHKRARLGDTVMWEIKNNTSMAHPWHLHGFSYQPLEFVFYAHEMVHTHPNTTIPDVDTFVHYPFEASEFEDTTLIPPHTALRYLVRIDDPNGNQGSVGRWLKHCHIFQHGGNGMMSELVIDP